MRKVLSLEILLITFMILLNTIPSESKRVSVLLKHFHGLDNVTIADDMEFEFLHSSNVERMLADAAESYFTPNALIAEKAAANKYCKRPGKPYSPCLPDKNHGITPEHCSTYKRGC